MIKKTIREVSFLCCIAAAMMIMASCQSKEEQVISQLEDICEIVESDDFTSEDFDAFNEKYQKITSSLNECEFTNEQLQEIGKLQGRIASAMAKQSLKSAGDILNGVVNAGKGFIEGLSGDDE